LHADTRRIWSIATISAMREHEQNIDALKRLPVNELGLLMFQHMQGKCEPPASVYGTNKSKI
jgi:hypothetical protein